MESSILNAKSLHPTAVMTVYIIVISAIGNWANMV